MTPTKEKTEQKHAQSRSNFKDRLAKKRSLFTKIAPLTAVAAMASITQQAEAAIVSFNYDLELTPNVSFNVDPTTGILAATVSQDIFTLTASNGIFFRTPSNGSISNSFIPRDSVVDSTTAFTTSFNFEETGLFETNQFVGFQLENQGDTMNETHFGFFEVRFNGRNDASLIRSVLDDTGGSIAVPEPSTTLLAGITLLLGVSRRRRRS